MQFVASLLSVSGLLSVPYALKAAAAVYAEYYAPAGANIHKPTLGHQLMAVLHAAAGAPLAIARECTPEFKYAMYKHTLTNFDSVTTPQAVAGMEFSPEPEPAVS